MANIDIITLTGDWQKIETEGKTNISIYNRTGGEVQLYATSTDGNYPGVNGVEIIL